jgi:hypothetical protein
MAVAHLEELNRPTNASTCACTLKEDSSSSNSTEESPVSVVLQPKMTPPAPPAPQPFFSSKTARVVSCDSIPSYSNNCEMTEQPSSSCSSNSSKSLANILADPSSWLQSTEQLSLPTPPTDVISSVVPEDVLCGRGGETNHHPGNIQYRNLVKAFQPLYIASKRRDKPRIAQCIVYTIRAHQGGRFLKRTDPRSNSWIDVGNTKAREKTSQALREGAPELRGTEKAPSDFTATTSTATATSMNSSIPTAFLNTTTPMPQLFPHHAFQHALTPLQQAMSRALLPATTTTTTIPPPIPAPSSSSIPVFVTPITPRYTPIDSTASTTTTTNRKRPSLISDGNSSDASQGSNSTSSSIPRGPRLKRLKLRLEMQDGASS